MRASTFAAAAALLAFARPAGACATAPPPGAWVQIAEESAIIAWDAAAHREHFIRRASFRGTGVDFGFLVPTPGKPELAEVADHVFDQLEEATKPAVVVEREIDGVEPTLLCALCAVGASRSKSAVEASAPVRVLDAQRVAGYDAVVLEADSARALAAWLEEHHYAQRPELAAWLAPYVAAKWKLTAFKIAPDPDARAVQTAAVRLTFTTDRPFFPYREPSDQRENLPADMKASKRLLRVFFFGTERVDGTLGSRRRPLAGEGRLVGSLRPRARGRSAFRHTGGSVAHDVRGPGVAASRYGRPVLRHGTGSRTRAAPSGGVEAPHEDSAAARPDRGRRPCRVERRAAGAATEGDRVTHGSTRRHGASMRCSSSPRRGMRQTICFP